MGIDGMTDKDIETLVELTAMKAAKQAIAEAKEEWAKDITLHTAQCEARRYRGLKNLLSAGVGGGIVAAINWLLQKF
jgi:hypothetical protein